MWYLHPMEFYTAMKKNEIFIIRKQMDGTGEYHPERLARPRRPKIVMFSLICRL
jgi:hypothetical protein